MYEIIETEFLGAQIFKAIFSGEINRELVIRLIDDMAHREESHPKCQLLVDLTQISKNSLDIEDIKEIVNHVKANSIRQGKMAFLTGDNLGHYLLLKLYVDLVGVFKSNLDQVFKFEEEALDWLEMPKGYEISYSK